MVDRGRRGGRGRAAVTVGVATALLAFAFASGCGGEGEGEAGSGEDDPAASDGEGAAAGDESTESGTTVGTVAPEGAEPEGAPVLPVTVTDADGDDVTVDDASRIIPVNGDIAEVVFALGLGDQVVATDLSATYPPEADALPEVGYQRTLLAEQILGLSPTVVLANTDAGPPEVLDFLREAGVAVVVIDYPHDLTGPAAKVRLVAQALGVPARGEALVGEVEAAISTATDEATAQVEADEAAGGEPLRAAFLYLRGTNVQQVGGRGSGVDALLEAAGVVDIGVELGVDEFQPLTDEALLEAAPDVLVVTTTGLESVGGVDGLVEIPAIVATPAGRDRRVIALDDQLLLGLGPRAGEALQQLVDELHTPTPMPTDPAGPVRWRLGRPMDDDRDDSAQEARTDDHPPALPAHHRPRPAAAAGLRGLRGRRR